MAFLTHNVEEFRPLAPYEIPLEVRQAMFSREHLGEHSWQEGVNASKRRLKPANTLKCSVSFYNSYSFLLHWQLKTPLSPNALSKIRPFWTQNSVTCVTNISSTGSVDSNTQKTFMAHPSTKWIVSRHLRCVQGLISHAEVIEREHVTPPEPVGERNSPTGNSWSHASSLGSRLSKLAPEEGQVTLYERGVPSDTFTLILQGRVLIRTG